MAGKILGAGHDGFMRHSNFRIPNILLLNINTTAVLDTLQPDFVTAAQDVLAVGESLFVNAPVIGTIATMSTSKAVDPTGIEPAFKSVCANLSWTQGKMDRYDDKTGSSLWLLDEKDNRSNQSMQYVAFAPLYLGSIDCPDLLPYVQLYNVYRQQCRGTWSITRAGIQLTNASCDGARMSALEQTMILKNTMKLEDLYMQTLLDFLAPFSPFGSRNQSSWNGPYTATSVAAMLWSRVVALNTNDAPLGTDRGYNTSTMAEDGWMGNDTFLTFEEIKLLYPVSLSDQTIFHIRPTLHKSRLLYFALALQPLLTVIILGFIFAMHSVPLDNGFGSLSILSGINAHTLDVLSGESLSGELKHPLKLIICPTDNGQTGRLEFRAMLIDTASGGKTRLRRDILYHSQQSTYVFSWTCLSRKHLRA